MGKRTPPVKYSSTVAGAVSDAFSIIESLAEEMREAYDNTPESLQQSGVGEMRGEAADALENISEPDVPKTLAELVVEFEYTPTRRPSRRVQRDEAVNILSVAISVLEAANFKKRSEADEDREAAISEIQEMLDEADGVEFPGMYG